MDGLRRAGMNSPDASSTPSLVTDPNPSKWRLSLSLLTKACDEVERHHQIMRFRLVSTDAQFAGSFSCKSGIE